LFGSAHRVGSVALAYESFVSRRASFFLQLFWQGPAPDAVESGIGADDAEVEFGALEGGDADAIAMRRDLDGVLRLAALLQMRAKSTNGVGLLF
jgi:hypothetical protein